MINPPMTREEARKWWHKALSQRVACYIESNCSFCVARWTSMHQCSRKPGHGPDGLYCKQHAGMAEQKGERDGE